MPRHYTYGANPKNPLPTLSNMLCAARSLGGLRCVCFCPIRNQKKMDSQTIIVRSASCSRSPPAQRDATASISVGEWQGWGTSSQIPAMVVDVIRDLNLSERDMEAQMSFGGLGGKLQGEFKAQEDKKHRATYQALNDSEKKLQFFAARQIACRLLGSRGYLCQKVIFNFSRGTAIFVILRCWLAMEDCMCTKLVPCSLRHGIRFWLYMHPKDFLRQNNSGKLLWQIFGIQAASLCLFSIQEHEEIMWNAFKHAGKDMVWCLYPNKNASPKSVQDIFSPGLSTNVESQSLAILENKPLNFILIDGTWSKSAAMFRRLKEHAKLTWGDDELPCISLSMPGVSAMHKLRPQPSWDRTCTAAAAIGLLAELHTVPSFSTFGLENQAEAVENGLDVLLDALTGPTLADGEVHHTQRKKEQPYPKQSRKSVMYFS